MTRALLSCGAVAGPVFVASFVAQGRRRQDYDPRRHPISSLAIGSYGWQQRVTFWTTGALYLAGTLGLWRESGQASPLNRWGPILLSTVGVGLVGAGTFVTDPVSGYPAGSAGTTIHTTAGQLHNAFSTPVFLCLPAAAAVYARAFARSGQPAWSAALVVAALGQLGTFVAAGAGFGQRPSMVATAGVYQRASVAIGFGWVTAVCVRALRRR